MTPEQIADRIADCQCRLFDGMAMLKAGELVIKSGFVDERHALNVESIASRTLEIAYNMIDDINRELEELSSAASDMQMELPASTDEGEGVES